MPNLMSQLIVSLIDKVTNPAKQATEALKGINQAAGSSRQMVSVHDDAAAAAQRHAQALSSAKAQMIALGAAFMGTYYKINKYIEAMSAVEQAELGMKRRSNLTREQIRDISDMSGRLSLDLLQSRESIMANITTWMTMAKTGSEAAIKAMTPVGKVATGFGLDMNKVTIAGALGVSQMKLQTDDLMKMYGQWAAMSKAGGAASLEEITDAFPSLARAMGMARMTGDAAALGIVAALNSVKLSTGTTERALKGLYQSFAYLYSPRSLKVWQGTTSDKGKYTPGLLQTIMGLPPGATLEGEMQKRTKDGLNPLLAFVKLVANLTNQGKNADLMAKLFPRPEARAAVQAMIDNYGELFKQITTGAKASGEAVTEAFDDEVNSIRGILRWFDLLRKKIDDTIGHALVEDWKNIHIWMKGALVELDTWVGKHPQLVANFTEATLLISGLAFAMAALKFAALWTGISAGPFIIGIIAAAAAIKFIKENAEGLKTFFGAFAEGMTKGMDPQKAAAFKKSIEDIKALIEGSWKVDAPWADWGYDLGQKHGTLLANMAADALAMAQALKAVQGMLWPEPPDATNPGALSKGPGWQDVFTPDVKDYFYGRDFRAAKSVLGPLFDDLNAYLMPKSLETRRLIEDGLNPKFYHIGDFGAALKGDLDVLGTWAASFKDKIITDLGAINFGEIGKSWGQSIYDGVVGVMDSLVAWFKDLPAKLAVSVFDLKKTIQNAISGVVAPGPSMAARFGMPEYPPLPVPPPPPDISVISHKGEVPLSIGTALVDEAKKKVDEVGTALTGLVQTYTPHIDPSELIRFRDLVNDISNGLSNLGSEAVNKAYTIGGRVRQMIDSVNSDYPGQR